MIRRIFATAVPAALVAVGMSLAISEPASSQLSSGGGGGATTNTNQVYPNNRRSLVFKPGITFQLSSGGGRGGNGFGGVYEPALIQIGVSSGRGGSQH